MVHAFHFLLWAIIGSLSIDRSMDLHAYARVTLADLGEPLPTLTVSSRHTSCSGNRLDQSTSRVVGYLYLWRNINTIDPLAVAGAYSYWRRGGTQ
jgi:hypothetical protein